MFKEFIPPYSYDEDSYSHVVENLEVALMEANDKQESVTNKKRFVMLDVLAIATLQRGAIMNSIILIKDYYLR